MTTVFVGKWCVYGHYVDGKCIYIGMGRPGRAFNNTPARSREWLALVENGYEVELLSWHDTQMECLSREITLIREIRPSCNKMHNGWVPEAFKENWRRGRPGYVASAETKKKMSLARKRAWERIPPSQRETKGRKKIVVTCVDTGVTYCSMSEAAKQTGIGVSSISMVVNGHKKFASNGLTFVRGSAS